MPTTHRLSEACGGPRLLDLGTLTLALPFVLVTSVATSATPDLWSWTLWLLVNLGAVAATVPVVLVLRALRHRFPRPAALPVAVSIGALIGITKGLATTSLALTVNLIDNPWRDALGRSLNTAVIGALLIPALAALAAARDRWAEERALLMVELTRRALDDPGRAATEHRHALHRTTTDLRTTLASLAPQHWPETIRTAVAQELRPLSAEILAASQTPSAPGGWTLLRVALQREPLSVGLITVLYASTSALLLVRHVAAEDAVLFGLALAAATAGLLSVTQGLRARWPSASPLWLGSCVITLAMVQGQLSDRIIGVVDRLDHLGITLVSALWFSEILVAVTVITAARRERTVIHERLLQLLGPHGVHEAIGHGVRALEGREFAFFIHGDLQNRLLALADRLERHSSSGDGHAEHIEELGEQVLAVLGTLDEDRQPLRPLTEHLEEIAARWRGLAEIHITSTGNPDTLGPRRAEQVVHVIVEGVTNAVRHGAARRIWLHLDAKQGGITVIIDDDGFGPRRGRPGTGSHYFDLVAGQDWELTHRPEGGSRLRVHLRW